MLFAVFPEHAHSLENFESPMCAFPAKVGQQLCLLALASSAIKKCPFLGLRSPKFFAFVADFAVVSGPQAQS